jgi:hypothetical protein
LGAPKIEFVGHDIDSEGINMSKKRIESTVNIREPDSLTELYQFLGVVNFFHDHIPNHSDISRPLTQMVAAANRLKSKYIIWSDESRLAFLRLKDLVNACPKLYYVDYTLPIYLCTDASDYAIGAYLYQVRLIDNIEYHEPIRFLSKTLTGAQLRWSTIEKEAYAIYFSLNKLDDLLGGITFTIRTDHSNLLFLNNGGSKKVLNWKLAIQHFDFFY